VSELVLAVDTTHEFGSLALAEGSLLLEELPLESPEGFGHVLHGRIASLLERHGRRAADVDCFAAASGPGSFTGVRVGLACVKGLAEAAGKPVAGIGNLMAMASFGSAPLRAAVLDARRGETYGAVYDAAGRPVVEERVGDFALWLRALPEGEVEFLAWDFTPLRAAFEGTRFANAMMTVVPRPLAAAVARLAVIRLREGRAMDPAALDADYVRRSDAELFWREY
jgi:tRNA threonylcarbamoyladenosine biosynthesis protein TsaB